MSDCEYIVFPNSNDRYDYDHLELTSSDPYNDERVRSYDHMLHRTLRMIFCDRIENFLRASHKQTKEKSIFELILDREPALGKVLLKRNKHSLLWIAVLSCYQESAELLVRCGADVNELYGSFSSPDKLTNTSTLLHALLQMYPSAWNERFIGMVIDHGADLKARYSDGCCCTVLHLAVQYHRVGVASMLLEKGAEVNIVNCDGMAPLHLAARTREAEELIPLLLYREADINLRDAEGKNVLYHLTSAPVEHADLARFLIEEGVSVKDVTSDDYSIQPIHLAIGMGYNELLNLFLVHGADANAPVRAGLPLELAARLDNRAALLSLLKSGANVDLKTCYNLPALHCACYCSNLEVMKILLSVGADMFVQDRYGATAFRVICCVHSMEHPNARLMLKALALGTAHLQPSMEFKDKRIIEQSYPEHWNYYQACIEEINKTRSTRFVATCTFFELLTKCQCQIAPLMRYREFASKFRLCDLSAFPIYAEDILEAFARAERCYESMLDKEDIINEAFYNILPYVVVRKVVDYILNDCEICEMKEIVQASRRAT